MNLAVSFDQLLVGFHATGILPDQLVELVDPSFQKSELDQRPGAFEQSLAAPRRRPPRGGTLARLALGRAIRLFGQHLKLVVQPQSLDVALQAREAALRILRDHDQHSLAGRLESRHRDNPLLELRKCGLDTFDQARKAILGTWSAAFIMNAEQQECQTGLPSYCELEPRR